MPVRQVLSLSKTAVINGNREMTDKSCHSTDTYQHLLDTLCTLRRQALTLQGYMQTWLEFFVFNLLLRLLLGNNERRLRDFILLVKCFCLAIILSLRYD